MDDLSSARDPGHQPVPSLLGEDFDASLERRYAALGRAAESNGLAWYGQGGEMLFQPPADMIAEQAYAEGVGALVEARKDAALHAIAITMSTLTKAAKAAQSDALAIALCDMSLALSSQGQMVAEKISLMTYPKSADGGEAVQLGTPGRTQNDV